MKPGRELDALIAEKVMGRQVVETDDCNGQDNLWLNQFSEYGDQLGLPNYSTDIAAAWTVVEKFKAVARIEKQFLGGNAEWFCELSIDIGEGSGSAISPSAPHAICLAALKAVGVEV